MCVPNAWRPFSRLGIPRKRLSIPPGSGWGGKNTGWLATWDCPLRTDWAFWKSLESFIQLISFCNSCILPVSSRIVFRSSTNFLLAKVSNVDPWNRFKSSISLKLTWASRRSQFCFKSCSWRSCCSRRSHFRLLDEHDNFLPLETRSFHFIQLLNTSSVIIGLKFVFSNLCLTVSEILLSLSFQKNPDLLTFLAVARNFSNTWNLWGKRFHNGSTRSIMTDGRRQTGRQTFFLRVIGSSTTRIIFSLLVEQWWRERLADGDVIVLDVIRGPILDRGFLDVVFSSIQNVVVFWLITCERVVPGKGAKVLVSWSTRNLSTTSWKMKLMGRRKDRMIREKMASKERKVSSRRES